MLASIINFSTNEAPFLHQCIEEAMHFSCQVVVVVADHLFDGTPENRALLQSIYASHPEVQFIEYEWSKTNFYGSHSPHYWHNINRLIGTHFLKKEVEDVLFLDVDEIVEGRRFASFLKNFPLADCVAIRLACYWYFREEKYRAKEIEDTPLLVSRKALHYDAIMHPEERAGTFHLLEGKKERLVTGEDNLPMIHHYSWVRNKEALLRKVQCWGHRGERDWEALIEKEFAKEFLGKDFVHGYDFIEVEPYLKPATYALSNKKSDNVTFLNTRDIHKIDLALRFGT